MIGIKVDNNETYNPNLNEGSLSKAKIRFLSEPYYWFLFIGFFYNTIIFYAVWVLGKLPLIGGLAQYLVPTVLVLGVLFAGKRMLSRVRYADILFVFYVIITLFLSIAIHPSTSEIIYERYISRVFFTCIPYFLLGLVINSDDVTFDFLGGISDASILIGVVYLYYMLNFGNPEAIGTDNMGLAYNYLIVEMLAIIYGFRKKKWLPILIAVVGGVLVISLGTRGPVVLTVVFLLCCVLMRIWHNRRKRILATVGFSSIIVLVYLSLHRVVLFLSTMITKVGLSTRVLDSLLNENMFSSWERTVVRQTIMQKISENPIIGYGVAGEWQFVGWNAHNMYLTFLCNFGVVLGSAMLIIMMVLTWRAFRRAENENAKYLIIMFACLVFALGFFSGEPLTMYVFFLIGFCVNQLRSYQNRNRSSLRR